MAFKFWPVDLLWTYLPKPPANFLSLSTVRPAATILGTGMAALVLATLLDFPHGPEHWSADLRTALLSKRPESQHKRIALVNVTDQTLDRLAQTWPSTGTTSLWPDRMQPRPLGLIVAQRFPFFPSGVHRMSQATP